MPGRQYRAFLSYSHSDEAFARWLHRRLERWPVPKDLANRASPPGRIPASLRPIFRDREDFASGASLQQSTLDALAASEFLVVICSPHSAASTYVNEEIRLFRALGRGDRILPVILAGEPGAADDECFPAAIREDVDADGNAIPGEEEPIAADARAQGDGRDRAAAKLAAALLGVSFDEIIRRHERDRRRRRATLAGLVTGAVLFATVLSGYAIYQSNQAELALSRTGFAISTMMRISESLDGDEDVRRDLLLVQCDLLEGLSGKKGLRLPADRATCAIQRAVAHLAVGEVTEARGLLETLHAELESLVARRISEVAAQKGPERRTSGEHELAVALHNVGLALDRMRQVVPEIDAGHPRRAFESVSDLAMAWPDHEQLVSAYAGIVWRQLSHTDGAAEEIEVMRRASQVRETQLEAAFDPDRDLVLDTVVLNRRLAYFVLWEGEGAAAALPHAERALARADVLMSAPTSVNDLIQLMLAQSVLGVVQRQLDMPDADVRLSAAVSTGARILASEHASPDERSTAEAEIRYLKENFGAREPGGQ
ncbi:MAG: toll/interleukin-1 receptor domain-containing protein [Minwuia sp.]|uniref:toll/interleukin-1 receptor domain-containing protein n=1 Tax=Minwuia sp. TaxID=2493630 RepID=UPI003A8A3D92